VSNALWAADFSSLCGGYTKEQLIAAMGEVGRLFEENEYFVPEMLVSARAIPITLRGWKSAMRI
jgi:methanogenic corrinoid protein MtbC1